MSPAVTTFLFEIANFLILASVLGWLLFTPIRNSLEARKAAQEKQAQDAAAKLAEAERTRADIQRERRSLQDEQEHILKDARLAAQKDADAILSQAREAASLERTAALRELSNLTQVQLERLAVAVASASRAAVEKLLVNINGPDLERQLVQSACAELRRLDGKLLGPIIIESAAPLAAESVATLNATLGDTVAARYQVRPDLQIGLRIQSDRGMIDASALGLASYAERVLRSQLAARNGDGCHERAERSESVDGVRH